MLEESKLSQYLERYPVTWIPEMPAGVPPEDICVPYDHVLFRLTDEETIQEDDLMTHYEKYVGRDWGENFELAFAVSMIDDLCKAEKYKKFPTLKNKKAVSRIVLNPENGVVKQTTSRSYHYSWWKTNVFDMSLAETVKKL